MCSSGRPIALLLFCLFGSATSSPVSIFTPAPPLPSQILSPSPTLLPSLPSPSVAISESTEKVNCPLVMSPSALVVRFGDPVTANCSLSKMGFSGIGWEVSQAAPEPTMDSFLVWSVDALTNWSIVPMCYALSEEGGSCHLHLPIIIYKPPDNVSISFLGHTGPMFEGRQYTLQCSVQDVAPVQNLVVTFYGGQTVLGQRKSNSTKKEPVTEVFSLNFTPSKEDDGVQYWCEAKLDLGPEGPQHPQVVMSQNITDTVLFGPQLACPAKLQVREGESLSCEVRGNPQPSVTWFRDGQAVAPPTHSYRRHAGKYTVSAQGLLGQKNFTVEVEVLTGSGTTNSRDRYFLLAILLIQMIY